MKKYLSFFRLRFSMGLQYRTAAWAGIATQFAWGFMLIMSFKAFYEADAAAFPMTFQATVSYIWLQQAFFALFSTWMTEPEIVTSVMNGNVAYEFCRPIRIYHMWFTRTLATRVSRALLRCIPVLTVAALLPKPYGLAAPVSWQNFVLFALALVMGLCVTVAFCMFVYGLCFFTISPQGVTIVFSSAAEFLAGGVIPLPFFPDKVRAVMELLPFASMQNVPLRIYSGDLAGADLRRTIAVQVFWLAALVLGGRLLFRFAERKVSVQGG